MDAEQNGKGTAEKEADFCSAEEAPNKDKRSQATRDNSEAKEERSGGHLPTRRRTRQEERPGGNATAISCSGRCVAVAANTALDDRLPRNHAQDPGS